MPEANDLLDGRVQQSELEAESALRPQELDSFVGQSKVVAQLSLLLSAAKKSSRTPDHILLAGPPGLGKTTLAMIVATEMGVPIRITSGPALTHAGDLASILTTLNPGEIFFIDEIHRASRTALEMLYLAMEDFRVDVILGKGAGATAVPIDLPPFTLIGATTRSGSLPSPLRDRFGFTAAMEFYEEEDLAKILERSANLLSINLDSAALEEISKRSRGTPRVANRLLRRVRDYKEVHGEVGEWVDQALQLYEVDPIGLDRMDRNYLKVLADNFGGGPTGLNTIALALGEEAETLESICEPYLVRMGLLARTPRGRALTFRAYQYMGRKAPPGAIGLDLGGPTLFDQ
jgi:holliday junction DNA helicase RuvB